MSNQLGHKRFTLQSLNSVTQENILGLKVLGKTTQNSKFGKTNNNKFALDPFDDDSFYSNIQVTSTFCLEYCTRILATASQGKRLHATEHNGKQQEMEITGESRKQMAIALGQFCLCSQSKPASCPKEMFVARLGCRVTGTGQKTSPTT
ncbi:hypothetical protein TREES_T100011378 [Tupaia chinensis]|uniref:Uncharacterized protein n=1 Tax=Tupaia chinensis TaxID=246437 RepID=L9LCD9_TUPCH|nr:hypothetical protein TREES_T100011378 [Tupaia chinensis]